MSVSWQTDAATFTRVRVRSEGLDPLLARTRLTRLLNAVSLRPIELPPGAVLCVRSLADPLPGALRLDRSNADRPPLGWEMALRGSLDGLLARAARPIRGPVAANAPSVVFADEGELLACLALDWLHGELVQHWWWPSLLGSSAWLAGAQAAVLAAWRASVAFVPRALYLLWERDEAIAFAASLTVHEAEALFQIVTRSFGLATLQPLAQQLATSGVGSGPATGLFSVSLAAPPWRASIPRWDSGHGSLTVSQAAFLGIGLALHFAPSQVHAPAFAEAVRSWMSVQAASQPSQPSSAAPSEPEAQAQLTIPVEQKASPSPEPGSRADWATPRAQIPPPPDAKTTGAPSTARVSRELQAPIPVEPAASSPQTRMPAEVQPPEMERHAPPETTSAPTDAADSSGKPVGSLTLTAKDSVRGPDQPHPSAITDNEPPASVEWPELEQVITAYGGIFYLINFGIYQGLYADFSSPLEPGIDLNIYGFVAAVGDRLTGPSALGQVALRDDPVWSLLARLAGCAEDEPPGKDWTGPDGESLDQWLDERMSEFRGRLNLALGTFNEDPSALPRLLLAEPGRVIIAPTRLDIYFSLDDHPVAIRLSGLDRDPGWVPAAGRFIAFHYE